MNRREFITLSGCFFGSTLLTPLVSQGARRSGTPIKFGIITDIHNDIMHDGEDRLSVFLEAAKKENVDFIIQLGDFCQVKDSNKPFVDLWSRYEGEK